MQGRVDGNLITPCFVGVETMPIRLIQGASFNPETTRLLGLAYERACESVSPDVTVREALAKRIIEAARRGERDLDKLIEYGVGNSDGLADARDAGQSNLAPVPPATTP
jgi:hypothetical protein